MRGQQTLATFGDRWLSSGAAEINDRALLRAVHPTARNGSAEGTAALILERIHASNSASNTASGAWNFLPALAQRAEIFAIMEQRFAGERQTIIARADRICAGRFNLLGLTDLSFGDPIDWHLEPLSGKRAPLTHWSQIAYLDSAVAGDKKITWELNRHQFFITLGQAYWMTDDERYAEAFVAQSTAWMDANPPGRGINWASSLEVAFRSISWVWALHLFAGSERLTPKFMARVLTYLTAHGRHIERYLSHYFSPNTHLTGEALGLFYLGTALPELRRANVWRATGLRILLEQLATQVRRDGVYFEQSSYYHRYTADFYTHLLVLARASKIELPVIVEEKLAVLMDHLLWITRPDGTSPLLGDDDGGRLVLLGEQRGDDFRDTLAIGAGLFERADWKRAAGAAPVEMLWLLGPQGLARYDALADEPQQETTRAFSESGYFVLRDGWERESTYALFDCGPHGALACGHAHADALALEFAAAGINWLIDPGTYTYTGDAQCREFFRGTAAHNTAVVDGQSQSVTAGPFSWSSVAQCRATEFAAGADFSYFAGEHDGYQRLADPVRHARAALFLNGSPELQLPSYLVVRDSFEARARHQYALQYHFSSQCQAEVQEKRLEVTEPGGASLKVIVFGPAGLQTSVRPGWVSRCYGQREPAPVGVIEAECEGPQEFVTFILPFPADQARPDQARPNQARNESRQFVARQGEGGFGVVSDGVLDFVLMGDGLSLMGGGELTALGATAWGRFVDGRPLRAGLVCGRMLEVNGQLRFESSSVVRYCALRFQAEQLELVVRGTSRFELTFFDPVRRVAINGTGFEFANRARRAVFMANGVDDGAQWQLISVDE